MAIDVESLNARGKAALAALMPDPVALVSIDGCGPGGNFGREGYASGALRESIDAAWVCSYAALTGSEIGKLPQIRVADVPAVFERAREVQRYWAGTRFSQRRDLMQKFIDGVVHARDELLDLIQWENGKNRACAFEEVYDVVANAAYYGRHASKLLAPKRTGGAVPLLTYTRTYHHPKGVVAVISPWNYPLTLAISDALAAIMAGNSIVIKPDSLTPYTALACKALLDRAGFPPDLLQVIIGSGPALGEPMIREADYVMFTGSSATGATIAREAGEALIGFSAELGGKNPLIVRADAPMPRAVRGAVKACFASSGQLCISIERMYVHTSIWDEFVPAFVQEVEAMKVAAGFDWEADMGPLIGESQFNKVREHVEDAVAKGATVLAGGKALPEVSQYAWAPTVLTGVTPEMDLFANETFGPVVSLYRVASDEAALRLANTTDYGLNAAIWSSDMRAAQKLAVQIHAGAVNINDGYAAAWGSMKAPSGGMGISGIGRRHGLDGIVKYTDAQAVATQRLMHIGAPGRIGPLELGEKKWAELLSVYMKLKKWIG